MCQVLWMPRRDTDPIIFAKEEKANCAFARVSISWEGLD